MILRNIMLLTSDVVSGAASEESAAASTRGSWLTSLSPLLMLAVFALVFYFFLIRPEKKRKKAVQDQRDSMKVGDTVVTIGGITGEVERIREETVTIFTGNSSMDVQKWAIRSVEADDISDDPAVGGDGSSDADGTDEEKKLKEQANDKGFEE